MCIAAVDLVQVAWLGKGFGAVAGAALYGGVAFGARRGWRGAAWVAVITPVLPATILAGVWGPSVGERFVDRGMIGVFVVQLAAAIAAMFVLRQPGGRDAREMR